MAALLSGPWALSFADQNNSAEQVLNRTMAEFRNPSEATEWVNETVALEQISRFVLGSHFKRISAPDRERFHNAYSAALKRMVLRERERFQIRSFRITQSHSRNAVDKVLTSQVITGNGTTETIRWRMRLTPEGWKIVDIEAFSVWLIVEQRAQIGVIIDRSHGDFDSVVEQLSQTFQ